MLILASIGIFYESGKEPGGLEDPPKLHLLVESNEEWRVSRWSYPRNLVLICLNWIGRASRPGDQATIVRSFRCRFTGGDAQPNRTGSLQRYLAATIPRPLYVVHSYAPIHYWLVISTSKYMRPTMAPDAFSELEIFRHRKINL